VDVIDMKLVLEAYRKPAIDAERLSEEFSLLMNGYFAKVRELATKVRASNDWGQAACAIMAWQASGSDQATLWEVLWKSRDTVSREERFMIESVARWLARFGVWFPEVEVHLLQRGKGQNEVVPRCFASMAPSLSSLRSLREGAVQGYEQVPERSKEGGRWLRMMVYSESREGAKIFARETSSTTGKICTSYKVEDIHKMLGEWSAAERELIARGAGAPVEVLLRGAAGQAKVDLCAMIEYMFLLLELQSSERYVRHFYSSKVVLLAPTVIS
jgi:hypothetical protein